jgi:putative selenate reductase
MTDKFFPLPLKDLLRLILDQYNTSHSIFGIPEALFFKPDPGELLAGQRFGHLLESPVGVAAGPHTQLAQNIVAAWLCGARFIELKTIQTLDDLEIAKPCIDMQDEGYNCEWSQELKVEESFQQYLNAWIMVHILKDKLKIGDAKNPGFIFNMSVGYNLEGILKDNVQWFLNKMSDASQELTEALKTIKDIYPNIDKLHISPQLSDNITLSTMHGCPPDEIEQIGQYLLSKKKLHTSIKLNPTLLGKEELSEILKNGGFETQVPDLAFGHDLKYEDAKGIIERLSKTAQENKLHFGLKLTNTLESRNHRNVFPPEAEMMYMSGRALHPISVNLARKLQNDFAGKLDISFSGGADAFNINNLAACGLTPVTVCSDLLKPGGYGRLAQYIENLRKAIPDPENDNLQQLNNYADLVKTNAAYQRNSIHEPNIKTNRELHTFDCIAAPCVGTCPTHQEIPDYMYHTANGDLASAAKTVINTNPFPQTTGMVCDHLCQNKCTRINYDSSLHIREVKRVIAENAADEAWKSKNQKIKEKKDVAIIGAGPSGLSCAWFLAKAGFNTVVFETKPAPGGMVSGAIPAFRLTGEAFDLDLQRIQDAGVKIHYNHHITKMAFETICTSYDFVYVAAGAQKSRQLNIEGMDAKGVYDPLDLLFDVKSGGHPRIGKNILIIGGGNTAMDAARTAVRLAGEGGKVTIVYRRTIKDMPADRGEIKACFDEGVEFLELTAPVKIISRGNYVSGLLCRRMQPGEPDETGRRRPIEIPESDFIIEADAIIPAVGQERDFEFVKDFPAVAEKIGYQTGSANVFVGGDALRGASTAINAIADGRLAAEQIILAAGRHQVNADHRAPRHKQSLEWHILKRTRREQPPRIEELPPGDRLNFDLVINPLTLDEGIKEAQRCMLCDEYCSICTTLCPNMALFTYQVHPAIYQVNSVRLTKEKIEVIRKLKAGVAQKYQILHLPDWCNQCGNCTTFCPTAGAPYKDKPHLHISRESFEADKNGFFFDGEKLLALENQRLFSLKKQPNGYTFQSLDFLIELNHQFEIQNYTLNRTEVAQADLSKAVEMHFILIGANALLNGLYNNKTSK